MSTKTPARMISFAQLNFVPRAQGGDQAQLASICGTEEGSELGCGVVRLKGANLDWTVKYDEVLFVLEGSITVTTLQGVFTAGPHDSIWLPKDTPLTYEADNALVFYALHPANWADG